MKELIKVVLMDIVILWKVFKGLLMHILFFIVQLIVILLNIIYVPIVIMKMLAKQINTRSAKSTNSIIKEVEEVYKKKTGK